MRTLVYYKSLKNRTINIVEKSNDFHWARWKSITVGLWEKIIKKQQEAHLDPFSVEKRLWKYALINSSIIKLPKNRIRNKTGSLSKEALDQILKYNPSKIPTYLVRPLFSSVYLSESEELRIRRECELLWTSKDTHLTSPHPFLEIALDCMNMKEKYDLSRFATLVEIPQKLYVAMKLVLNVYSNVMEKQKQSTDYNERAKKIAGIR